MSEDLIEGYVARLLTDEEVILNVGKNRGVAVGMRFYVFDPDTQNVPDPLTGENLGSLDRRLAEVVVDQVTDRMCVASRSPRRATRTSLVTNIFADIPERTPDLSPDLWPEGVRVGCPARQKPEKKNVVSQTPSKPR